MKRKILYMLVILCFASAICAARQSGRISRCRCVETGIEMGGGRAPAAKHFDLSPLSFFVLSI